MASSKVIASTALFLCLNLLFSVLVSSEEVNVNDLLNSGNYYPNGSWDKENCKKMNLGACSHVLGLRNNGRVGKGVKPSQACCKLIAGLSDLEAVLCLSVAITYNESGHVESRRPINLSTLLEKCGRSPGVDYMCSPRK